MYLMWMRRGNPERFLLSHAFLARQDSPCRVSFPLLNNHHPDHEDDTKEYLDDGDDDDDWLLFVIHLSGQLGMIPCWPLNNFYSEQII